MQRDFGLVEGFEEGEELGAHALRVVEDKWGELGDEGCGAERCRGGWEVGCEMGKRFFADGFGVVGEEGEVVEELRGVGGRAGVDRLRVEDEGFTAEGSGGEVVGFARRFADAEFYFLRRWLGEDAGERRR